MKGVNDNGRRPGGSELIALDIDDPGAVGLFNMRSIKPIGYKGATGNSDLDLLGFDVQVLDDNTMRFYFVNQRPPVGAFNNIIDATKIGANSTIEIFETRKGEEAMRHVRTIWNDQIWTPNRVAAVGDGSGAFLVTNDHSVKVGWVRKAHPFPSTHALNTSTSVANSTTSSAAVTLPIVMATVTATLHTAGMKKTTPSH
jgi:hypothetical protein